MTENKKTPNAPNRRVHMANERTFLAWTRTSIGIMAFGFVVERFAFFLKQMSYILGKDITLPQYKYSSVMGIVLVGFGVLMGVLSFIRYRKIERQIDDGIYQP
jgi:putative membrane protein